MEYGWSIGEGRKGSLSRRVSKEAEPAATRCEIEEIVQIDFTYSSWLEFAEP